MPQMVLAETIHLMLNARFFVLQSRTEKYNVFLAKCIVEIIKDQNKIPEECIPSSN
jgi:hypothetical protein